MNNSYSKKDFILICAAFILINVFVIYILGDRSLNVMKEYSFSQVFYDMWVRLSDLDISASKSVVMDEGFVVNGKVIAYNLPFPALIRGFLDVFHLGQSPILSVLLGVDVFILFSLAIFNALNFVFGCQGAHFQGARLIVSLGLVVASPIFCMLAYPVTYWEAIIWAAAMLMGCSFLSLQVLTNPGSAHFFVIFSVFCGLSLYTRPTTLVAVSILFALTSLSLIKIQNCGLGRVPILAIGASIFSFFMVGVGFLNYVKWGSPFEFAPMKYYTLMWDSSQLENFQKFGIANIDRVPEAISYYFFPSWDNFQKSFPWIKMGSTGYFSGFAEHFDYREDTLPISVVLPLFLILSTIGISIYIRNLFIASKNKNILFYISAPVAISIFIPGLIMLPWFALAVRYTGEFIPSLTLASIYATVCILKNYDHWIVGFNKDKKKIINLCVAVFLTVLILLSSFLEFTGSWLQHHGWNRKSAYSTPPEIVCNNCQIQFGKVGAGVQYLDGIGAHPIMGYGWSYPEAWGVWSLGKHGSLVFWLPNNRPNKVVFHADAVITSDRPFLEVEGWVNGKIVETYRLSKTRGNDISMIIPPPDIESPRTWDRVFIEFKVKDHRSPKELNIGEDDRPLGIGLVGATFSQ